MFCECFNINVKYLLHINILLQFVQLLFFEEWNYQIIQHIHVLEMNKQITISLIDCTRMSVKLHYNIRLFLIITITMIYLSSGNGFKVVHQNVLKCPMFDNFQKWYIVFDLQNVYVKNVVLNNYIIKQHTSFINGKDMLLNVILAIRLKLQPRHLFKKIR